jgi:RND superfamily putative drug exporter
VLGDGPTWNNFQDLAKKQLAEGEGVGFPIVLIVLLLAFGTLVAALAPLLLGFFAVFLTGAVIYLLSTAFEMSLYVTNMASMIGIGVAVDYSLFVVSHYRADYGRSGDREASLREALSSAGTAVVFSGATVVVSLAGLFLVPVNAVRSLAVGAIVVVSIAVIATVTLLPALLALAGRRIERFRIPLPRKLDVEGSDAFWHSWSRRVMRRPVLFFTGGAGLLILIALPALGLHTEIHNLDQLPKSSEVRAATERAAHFAGPGFLGPVQVLVNNRSAARDVHDAVARVPNVASVSDPVRSEDGSVYLVEAVPAVDTQGEAGRRVHAEISAAADRAVGTRDASLVVGGVTAHNKDAAGALSGGLWKIVLFILAVSYLVLFVLLRSVLLPLKAVVMNMLSVGAAYGVLVMVFQWGWLDWTGYDSPGFLDSIVPVLVLAVTFGLSMDYEVFLLTRIRERWLLHGDNERAVAEGLVLSARIITSAALVMVAVFAAFVVAGAPSLKELGLGLAVAILLDATLVRLVIVPAAMRLLGRWNWWLPRPLARVLPAAQPLT